MLFPVTLLILAEYEATRKEEEFYVLCSTLG